MLLTRPPLPRPHRSLRVGPSSTLITGLLASALLVAGLSACGGGAAFGGGIGGSGVVFGSIEGLGSIVVNGIEFDTSAAEITIDGEPADESALTRGLVVRIEAEIDEEARTGVAERVESATVVEGPVSAVDLATDSATILGDTVVIDADTIFDGVVLEPGAVGRIVEVSGFVDADGAVRATRFAARAADGGADLTLGGLIADLDSGAETFTIRGLTIGFTNAAIENAPAGGLAEDLAVRVVLAAAPVGGVAAAVRIRVRPEVVSSDFDGAVQIRGFVTALRPPDGFVINNTVLVQIDRRTEFVGGESVDIRRNTPVLVVGRPSGERSLRAAQVVLRSTDVAAISPTTLLDPR